MTVKVSRAEAEWTSQPSKPSGEASPATPSSPATLPPALRPKRVASEQSSIRREASGYTVLKIANFENKQERNDFDGGYFGIWNKDPDDPSQGCKMAFSSPGQGMSETCIKLTYDVASFHAAYNGFWLLFVDEDFSAYSNICFWVRGDKSSNFTTRFFVELKNENEAGKTLVDNVTGEWKLQRIPLRDFGGVNTWTGMTEFVIVFEDRFVTKQDGVIYLDNIYFDNSGPKATTEMADPRLSHEEASKAMTDQGASQSRKALESQVVNPTSNVPAPR